MSVFFSYKILWCFPILCIRAQDCVCITTTTRTHGVPAGGAFDQRRVEPVSRVRREKSGVVSTGGPRRTCVCAGCSVRFALKCQERSNSERFRCQTSRSRRGSRARCENRQFRTLKGKIIRETWSLDERHTGFSRRGAIERRRARRRASSFAVAPCAA